ncbi:YbjN domain-containing protein [Aureimonas mangrovi]|uniref:YbjN domain-containing protein n=1 Tax=Aureimonas mangrovi TaxID=2758041 RepID=UPI00163D6CCA|nr:YbjN domain-containing protein [Aureimonas mangrovi]
MQLAAEAEVRRQSNPVDVVELVAATRDWMFERSCDDEIAVSVKGLHADYSVSFSWMEQCEALHLACAFDLKVPGHREVEVLRLLARINEGLLIGHFDLWPSEGVVMFRHTLLLSGGAEPTSQQAEQLLSCALEHCERYHLAFQFVIFANRSAQEALACSLFETVGRA